jgi:hypothetical protein
VTTPRRRILRPHREDPHADPRQQARLQRKREQLARDRIALKRWLTRLKRAANTVADLHQRITRLETLVAGS